MENSMTPKQSSILMTPSSTKPVSPSSTKPVFYSPRVLSPLPLATPKSSAGHPRSFSAYKDILSELYLGGLSLVAERIFSLLKPAELCSSLQVCTTWNRQISSGSQFMNSINTYRRQCKENAENLYVTEGPMETTVTPTKRRPFAAFTPNTQSRFQTAKPTYTVGMCIKPWHEGECSGRMTPSKRPRQSDGICSTKSKKRLRRLWTQGFISIDGWTIAILHLTLVQKSKAHSATKPVVNRLCIHCVHTEQLWRPETMTLFVLNCIAIYAMEILHALSMTWAWM